MKVSWISECWEVPKWKNLVELTKTLQTRSRTLLLGSALARLRRGLPRVDPASADEPPPPEWKCVPPSGVRMLRNCWSPGMGPDWNFKPRFRATIWEDPRNFHPNLFQNLIGKIAAKAFKGVCIKFAMFLGYTWKQNVSFFFFVFFFPFSQSHAREKIELNRTIEERCKRM